MPDIKSIADKADVIINGYAFTADGDHIHVLNLNSPDKALEAWMVRMLKKVMADYAHELKIQTASVIEGEELLSKLKALPNTPEGFLQLDTVLRPAKTSIEQLREEALNLPSLP
jgi:hypothetical protein